jgi:hypothetical protein
MIFPLDIPKKWDIPMIFPGYYHDIHIQRIPNRSPGRIGPNFDQRSLIESIKLHHEIVLARESHW